MSQANSFLKNENSRYIVYQIVFLLLFAIFIPFLEQDIRPIVVDKQQFIYVGILGMLAIVADTIGTIIKSKELRHSYPKYGSKSFNRFFWGFWIFRAMVFMGGAVVTGSALTGKSVGNGGFNMALMVEESIRWMVMGGIAYYYITSAEKKKLSIKTKFIGDFCILFSSLFYLTILWTSMAHNDQSFSKMDGYGEYYGAGILLFLMIYIPSTFFHYLTKVVDNDSLKDKLKLWVEILFTGIAVLTYALF